MARIYPFPGMDVGYDDFIRADGRTRLGDPVDPVWAIRLRRRAAVASRWSRNLRSVSSIASIAIAAFVVGYFAAEFLR